MGTFVLQRRAYYHCAACRKGHCPADDAFGLGGADLTPAAEQLAVLFGTTASFAEAAEKLLPKASGLRLAESTIERATEAAGDRLGQALTDGQTLGVAADWDWPKDAAGRSVAYVSIDATGVPIQGPGGVEADGRMAWVGKVFAPKPRAEPEPATRRPVGGRARYPADLMSPDELAEPLRRQAAQVGDGPGRAVGGPERLRQWGR